VACEPVRQHDSGRRRDRITTGGHGDPNRTAWLTRRCRFRALRAPSMPAAKLVEPHRPFRQDTALLDYPPGMVDHHLRPQRARARIIEGISSRRPRMSATRPRTSGAPASTNTAVSSSIKSSRVRMFFRTHYERNSQKASSSDPPTTGSNGDPGVLRADPGSLC
jgi:hypothetical protein